MDVISKVPSPVLKMFCSSLSDLLSLRSTNWALCQKVNSILVALAKQFDEQKIQVMAKEIQTIHQDAQLSQDQRCKKIEELKFGVAKSIIKEAIANDVQDMKNKIHWGLLPIHKQSIEQTTKIIKEFVNGKRWPVNSVMEQLLIPKNTRGLDFFGVQDPQVYAFTIDFFGPPSWGKEDENQLISAGLVAQNETLSQVSLGMLAGMNELCIWNANFRELIHSTNLKNILTSKWATFLRLELNFQGFQLGENETKLLSPLVAPFRNIYINNLKIEKVFDFPFPEKVGKIIINKLKCEKTQILRFENFKKLVALRINGLNDPLVLYKNCPKLDDIFPMKIRVTAWCNTGPGKSLFLTGKGVISDSVRSIHEKDRHLYWGLNHWGDMHPLTSLEANRWVLDFSHVRTYDSYWSFSIKFLLLDEHDLVHWQNGPSIDIDIEKSNTNEFNIRDIEFEEMGHPKSDFHF